MRPVGGYQGRILRVDLTSGSMEEEGLCPDQAREYIGGRGLNMLRLWEEVPAGLDGRDPENLLVFGAGPMNGTYFPGSGRFNVSAMSPQTGILGDSNAGGFFGSELKFAGYDQIVVTGRSSRPVYLWVGPEGNRLMPAEGLSGLDVWAVQEAILEEVGDPRTQIASTGPAAENGVVFAGVFSNLVRAAARTGMGAVMASKNLKAVAVRGSRPVAVARPGEFAGMVSDINRSITGHDQYESRCRYGTTRLISILQALGCLGTRHYRTGRFEGWKRVSGETLADLYKVKSKACFSCPVPCSRFIRTATLATEGPEFEGLGGFTAMCGSDDLEAALLAIDLCNRYGMDVIAVSEAVSFLMDCYQQGLIGPHDVDGLTPRWGDTDFIHEIIHRIARREGVGDLLADGIREAARRLGPETEELAMHVKGLEFFKADPRGLKGYALGVAVASRGGDHLRAEPMFEFSSDAERALELYGYREAAYPREHLGKGRLVKDFEEKCALADSWNACKNTLVNMEVLPFDLAARFYQAATGLDMSEEEMRTSCERIVNLERMINAREGMGRRDDTLPRRFLEEPLPEDSGPSAGQVVELDSMLDEYYRARGWNPETGLPEPETLRRLNLDPWPADAT